MNKEERRLLREFSKGVALRGTKRKQGEREKGNDNACVDSERYRKNPGLQ